MSASVFLLAQSIQLPDNVLRLALVAGLFVLLGIAFLYAALRCRRSEAAAPPPPPPLQLHFDAREHVTSDGQGCKTVSVQVKNSTDHRTLTQIEVRLEALEALHKGRLDAPPELPSLGMTLMSTRQENDHDGPVSLAPGETVSFLLAKSIVGDGYLYLPGCNAPGAPPPRKVTLAPYLATVTATAAEAPRDSLAIELPVAGRGIGNPKARRKSK